MDVHRLAGCAQGARTPLGCSGQMRADHPRQNVAGTGRSQPGVAGGVDGGQMTGGCDDRARALEHHDAIEPIGQLLRRGEAVCLHLRCGAAEQSRRFQGVRSDHRGLTPLAACRYLDVQRFAGGDGVERIGVQYQPG